MTDLSNGLILHLPLTEPLDSGPTDRSVAHNTVYVDGAPQLHGDRQLGAAHRFSGEDSMQIPTFGINGERLLFTLQLWVLHSSDAARNLMVIGDLAGRALDWALLPDGTLEMIFFNQGGNLHVAQQYPAAMKPGSWSQLTVSCDGRMIRTWVNGAPLEGEVERPNFALESTALLVAGGRDSQPYPRLMGSLAQIRVYDRLLSDEEIQTHYTADLALRAAFVESHPIRLSLLDANEDAVIYMSDHASGEPLTLEFFNLAGRALFFDPLTGSPGPNNHHFELRFRPGILHRSTLTPGTDQLRLLDETDWALSSPSMNADGTISFFCIRKTPGTEAVMLAPERAERIQFTNVRADPTAGARTGRVELRYAHLHLGGATRRLLQGAIVSQFSVLSHIGRSHLPLHSCFIGGNTILPGDDVSDNKLTLRLTNMESELPIPWQPGTDPWDDDKRISYFEIGFDYELNGEDKPWALCRENETLNLSVTSIKGSSGEQWLSQQSGAGEPPAWRIYSDRAIHLEHGEHIEITLSGLKTTLPSGSTNLYLRYANIPAYQAGLIVMTMEKSYLVVRENRIGIGTNSPTSTLHIAGTEGLIVQDADRFVQVGSNMIELNSQGSQAFFLPEALTMRTEDGRSWSELTLSGLRIVAENGTSTHLNDKGLMLHDRDNNRIAISPTLLAVKTSFAQAFLNAQEMIMKDTARLSSLSKDGLTVGETDATQKRSELTVDGLTVRDGDRFIQVGSNMIELNSQGSQAFFLPGALVMRKDAKNKSELTFTGLQIVTDNRTSTHLNVEGLTLSGDGKDGLPSIEIIPAMLTLRSGSKEAYFLAQALVIRQIDNAGNPIRLSQLTEDGLSVDGIRVTN